MNQSTATVPDHPFVFVTVGTDHHPFDRLINWADRWATSRDEPGIFIQSGTARTPVVLHAQYLDYEDLSLMINSSLGVVCHGGPATITEVRQSGKRPIVVPRRASLGEHVDDHQWRFATRLALEGMVHLVEDEKGFVEALDRLLQDPQSFRQTPTDTDHLSQTLTEFRRMVADILPH